MVTHNIPVFQTILEQFHWLINCPIRELVLIAQVPQVVDGTEQFLIQGFVTDSWYRYVLRGVSLTECKATQIRTECPNKDRRKILNKDRWDTQYGRSGFVTPAIYTVYGIQSINQSINEQRISTWYSARVLHMSLGLKSPR